MMNHRLQLIYCCLVFIIACAACRQKDVTTELVQNLNRSDTFLSDNGPAYYNKIVWEVDSIMGLESLRNGFDSIQLRISYGCALGKEKMIRLWYTNNKWQGELSDLKWFYSQVSKSDSLIFKMYAAEPKSGWERFIYRLFKLQILSITTPGEIPGIAVMDGCNFSVEIATKKIYRFYNYPDPHIHGNDPQSENVFNIVGLLNNEFGITDVWKGYGPTKEK